MRQRVTRPNRQLPLPFPGGNLLDLMPTAIRHRCLELLTQMLAAVTRGERIRDSNER
jgi:hypothetical protein